MLCERRCGNGTSAGLGSASATGAPASAAYSSDGGTLEIEFNDGATYCYSGVPVLVFLGLVSAASPGRYFASLIRDRYPYDQAG